MTTSQSQFRDAVRFFWNTLSAQGDKQERSIRQDAGARRNVTGGKQMDGFAGVIRSGLVRAGVPNADIHTGQKLEDLPDYFKAILPGYFRPTKTFDLIVVRHGELRVVLELKSHIGPSFGNNFNNRVEEALGSAADLWTAYREGVFGSHSPWLGYLMLLEDCPASTRPVSIKSPHFKHLPEFAGTSYAGRYEVLCRKLLRERIYSGAAFIMSKREEAEADWNYQEPAPDLGVDQFMTELLKAAT